MRFYLETYGCTANFGNSKDFEAALVQEGHFPSDPEKAELFVINTCAVTEKTERKILRRLRQLQGDRLIIAGCIPVALPESLKGIDCRKCLGILSKSSANEIFAGFKDNPNSKTQFVSLDSARIDLCGIVNIAEGCMGTCTYCIVRNARGKLNSREPDEIIESIKSLVKQGMIEIQLAGQDTAAYGRDIGASLPELLKLINEIPGQFKVRIGMMNADTVRPIMKDLIDAYRDQRIYKFLHLPIQSGSDEILGKMGRMYSVSDFIKILERFRGTFNNLYFTTDVISGFPSETIDDFNETLTAISAMQPDKVNITKFSKRPGTPAANLLDMPDRIKKQRSRELTKLWLDIADKRNRRYLGQVLEVVVTECGRGMTSKARSANYMGVVVQDGQNLGSILKTKILGSNPFYLKGIACS